jgi:glyoxylase-like metal-dependent hydrolase (beta-lactamase superfamily II)
VAGPIDTHPLRDDPVSGGAVTALPVGNRTLVAVSDGFLTLVPEFLGPPGNPTAAYDALRPRYAPPRLPLGCFLLPGDEPALIDAGYGPHQLVAQGTMAGGRLIEQLARQGVQPDDVRVLALSHLHADHVGWVGDRHGEPVFPNAQVYIGQGDWEYFVDGTGEPQPGPHILAALCQLADRGQVTLVDGEQDIAPGLRRLHGAGHTPGHSLYVAHDAGERVLLLGDAMYCPQQLTSLDWEAAMDVDPVLARRTRETLARDLERHGGQALGCHFPELVGARVLADPGRR